MPVETEVAELFFSKTQTFPVHCSCKGVFIFGYSQSYGGEEEEREKEEVGGGDWRDSSHGMGDLGVALFLGLQTVDDQRILLPSI